MNHIGKYKSEHFGSQPTSNSNAYQSKFEYIFKNAKDLELDQLFSQLFRKDLNNIKIQNYQAEPDSKLVTIYTNEDKVYITKLLQQLFNNTPITYKEFIRVDERNVYVKNLPLTFTKDQLEGIFKDFGEIISIKLMKKDGNDNQIAFVRFKEKASAMNAIEQVNKKKIKAMESKSTPIYCEISRAHQPNSPTKDPSITPHQYPSYPSYVPPTTQQPISPYYFLQQQQQQQQQQLQTIPINLIEQLQTLHIQQPYQTPQMMQPVVFQAPQIPQQQYYQYIPSQNTYPPNNYFYQ